MTEGSSFGREQDQDGLSLPPLKAVTASVLPAGGWSDLGHNYIFQAGFWGWFIAQSLKVGSHIQPICTSDTSKSCISWKLHISETSRVLIWLSLSQWSNEQALLDLQIFTKRYKTGIWDLRAVVESGGMPSSHSALTAVRFRRNWSRHQSVDGPPLNRNLIYPSFQLTI